MPGDFEQRLLQAERFASQAAWEVRDQYEAALGLRQLIEDWVGPSLPDSGGGVTPPATYVCGGIMCDIPLDGLTATWNDTTSSTAAPLTFMAAGRASFGGGTFTIGPPVWATPPFTIAGSTRGSTNGTNMILFTCHAGYQAWRIWYNAAAGQATTDYNTLLAGGMVNVPGLPGAVLANGGPMNSIAPGVVCDPFFIQLGPAAGSYFLTINDSP